MSEDEKRVNVKKVDETLGVCGEAGEQRDRVGKRKDLGPRRHGVFGEGA